MSKTVNDLKDKINAALKGKLLQTFNEEDDLSIPRLSSGILPLDKILGRGINGFGFPVGRICEVYGPESAGKTTVTLSTVASCQANGGTVAFIDAEHALNLEYAQKMGVVVEDLLICQPESLEEAFTVIEALADSGEVQLIVFDSIASLAPNHVLESGYEDRHMDTGAKLNTTFVKRLAGPLSKNNCTLLIINQIREKIGVMYGNPETTAGGRALKHSYSVRLEVRKGEVLKRDGEDYGHMMKCKIVKNKTAAPNKISSVRLVWGEGFDKNHSLVQEGLSAGILRKAGAWMYFGEDKFNGEEKMLIALEENAELRARLEIEVANV